jgi:hypothetical protein
LLGFKRTRTHRERVREREIRTCLPTSPIYICSARITHTHACAHTHTHTHHTSKHNYNIHLL